jgi:hypothetical protein
MIGKAKGVEVMRFFFKHIWFKSVLDCEILDFENVALTKVVHIYVIEGMNT